MAFDFIVDLNENSIGNLPFLEKLPISILAGMYIPIYYDYFPIFVYFIFYLDISAGPGEFSMNLTGTGFVIPDSVSVLENSNKTVSLKLLSYI